VTSLAEERPRAPRLGVQKQRAVKSSGGAPGQWWSPTWLAHDFARWCRIEPGNHVLDAGAGAGALTLALRRAGAKVTALEADPAWAEHLRQLEGLGVHVVEADFLAPRSRDGRQTVLELPLMGFHLVASNPPWEEDLPERFMMRAVELAPRACFIVPLNILCGVARTQLYRTELEPLRARALHRRPVFKGLTGGMRDVCFLEVRRRREPLSPHHRVRLSLEVGE
jgi:SAM-dependent methyltransferase